MSKIIVVGFGNQMRADDGLGPIVATRLEGLLHDREVRILVKHQMGVELIEDLKDADLALFIDARAGDRPGVLREEWVIADTAVPGSFSHHIRPDELLGSLDALYGRHPEAIIYSITAQSFDYGEGLSKPVEAALPALIDKVIARIAEFKAKNGSKKDA